MSVIKIGEGRTWWPRFSKYIEEFRLDFLLKPTCNFVVWAKHVRMGHKHKNSGSMGKKGAQLCVGKGIKMLPRNMHAVSINYSAKLWARHGRKSLCLGRNLHAFPRLAWLSINRRSEIRSRAALAHAKLKKNFSSSPPFSPKPRAPSPSSFFNFSCFNFLDSRELR